MDEINTVTISSSHTSTHTAEPLRPCISTSTGLLAGTIAILANMLVLKLGTLLGIVSAQGGLLKFLRQLVGPYIETSVLASSWLQLHLPAIDTAVFKNGFHVLIGLLMTLFYVWVMDPLLPRWPAWLKGLVYAVLVWLANALIILPTLGEGFAGHNKLDLAGMVYFAFAHSVFFLLLALLYETLRQRFNKA